MGGRACHSLSLDQCGPSTAVLGDGDGDGGGGGLGGGLVPVIFYSFYTGLS